MTELENIASELLKSANEADRIYAKTREQSQKDKATRLRVIVQNLKNLTLGASDLNGLSDVTLTSVTNQNGLVYDGATEQWTNQPIVNKIIAGANITISPISGTGNVTISTPHTGGLYSQTAPSTPITGITPGSLIDGGVGSLTIPADGFQVGDSFIAYFSGQLSCANNETMEIHLRSNGSILADTAVMTLAATTNKNWELYVNFVVRNIGGPGVASIVTSGRFYYNKNSNNNPESLGFYNVNNTTFDTTVSNTLAVTGQWGSNNVLNTMVSNIFNLYRIY